MAAKLEAYIFVVRSTGGHIKPSVTVWTDPHAIEAARVRAAAVNEQLGQMGPLLPGNSLRGPKTLKGELWLKPLKT